MRKQEEEAARGVGNNKRISGRMKKLSDKQSVNSKNIGGMTANQHDHGLTEVTTIESYDLTSAVDFNLNCGLSMDNSGTQAKSSRPNGADSQRKYRGPYHKGEN